MDYSLNCAFKELAGHQVRRHGRGRAGERRRRQNPLQVGAASRSTLPSGCISHTHSWRDPRNKDRKKTRCLPVAGRKKGRQRPRGWGRHLVPSGMPWQGAWVLTPHPPGSLSSIWQDPSTKIQVPPGPLCVLRCWLKTCGGGERNQHFSSCRTLSP